MEITNLTPQFTLNQEKGIYYVLFGQFQRPTETKVKLRITGVDAPKFSVVARCGCTVPSSEIISPTEIEVELSYNSCQGVFSKVVDLINNKKITQLKLQGECQQKTT